MPFKWALALSSPQCRPPTLGPLLITALGTFSSCPAVQPPALRLGCKLGGGRGGAQHLLALSPRLGVLLGPPPRICICTVTWDSNPPSCPRHTPRRALAQGAQTPLNQGALACLLPAPLTSRPSLPVCHFIAGPGRFFLSSPSFPQRESSWWVFLSLVSLLWPDTLRFLSLSHLSDPLVGGQEGGRQAIKKVDSSASEVPGSRGP